ATSRRAHRTAATASHLAAAARPDAFPYPQPSSRRTDISPDERLRTRAVSTTAAVLARLFAAFALLMLIVAPAAAPHAVAGEPGAMPFLQVRIDRVTPEVVTTTSEPIVTVTGSILNVGARAVRDVMVRLEHAAAVTSSAGLRTNL